MKYWLRTCVCVAALTGTFAGVSQLVNFVDVAEASGINHANTFGGAAHKEYIVETTGNGVAIFDYDGDGRNDVFVSNGTTLERGATNGVTGGAPVTSQLYRNLGGGKFEEVSKRAGIAKEGWGQGVCVGDYDNDGHPDMLVAYYGHNVLYHNTGKGTFEDATAAARLLTEGTRWGSACTFVDYDRDGYLDLFISNYIDLDLAATPHAGGNPNCFWKGLPVMCGPQGLPSARNYLYHNNRDGTFTDVSEQAGILKPGRRNGLGVVAADFDNDGWPDIYVACDMTASLLYHNLGNGTFEERGVEAGVAYNYDGRVQAGMGVAVSDYDGNGFLDIAKTNFSGDLTSLFKNEDGKFFTDVAPRSGLARNQLLGWGIAFLDVDEDGWKDLVVANGHVYPEVEKANVGDRYLQKTLLYRNLGNGRFADITAEAGPAFQVERASRGMAWGDLDGDGRPSIVIVNMNQKPSVLRNTGPRQNSLAVTLVGTKSNRSALNARVTVVADGRSRIDELLGGSSFFSQNESALYFGLGKTVIVDKVTVRWPSGLEQEWKGVAANQRILLTEGDAAVKTVRKW